MRLAVCGFAAQAQSVAFTFDDGPDLVPGGERLFDDGDHEIEAPGRRGY